MNVVVVGCGNMGLKRIGSISEHAEDTVAALVDVDPDRRAELAGRFGGTVASDYRVFLDRSDVSAVVVSTRPGDTWRIALDCLQAGKHVLCEKPLGRSVAEAEQVTRTANERRLVLKCGFNLRHDPGLGLAFQWMQQGRIGAPYFMKCTYANGAVGVNANGVGSLLDMGTHVLDLVRWFAGDVTRIVGASVTRHEYGVEDRDDNVFVIVEAGAVTVSLHCSFVRWRNAFSLEISGDAGAIEVESLPKWGPQSVRWHRRVYPSGTPELESVTCDGDRSWGHEWREFARAVRQGDLRWNNDGLAAMELGERIRACAGHPAPAASSTAAFR